uniref:NPH3 domain-containing protein n=1 Tax=Panagrellus redivivus TaxID=6233 RepID=A0A7E4ZTC9_PANRE
MGVDKDASPLGRLKIKHTNLKKMVDLKAKYGLNITYNKFTEMNETSICFLLLEKTLTTNVFTYIKKVIIPYMVEHNLQKDQTLLDYVTEISNKRSTTDISVTSPLQNVALEIASCIENPSFRCSAIIEQARQSVFPWSANLSRTVEKMLQNKDVPPSRIQDLKNQCRKAELGSYFLRQKRDQSHRLQARSGHDDPDERCRGCFQPVSGGV